MRSSDPWNPRAYHPSSRIQRKPWKSARRSSGAEPCFTPTPMTLHKDIRALIELCLSRNVDFLLVGGYALAFHGAPRFTEDIHLMVLASSENADKFFGVIESSGFANTGISRDDFSHFSGYLLPALLLRSGLGCAQSTSRKFRKAGRPATIRFRSCPEKLVRAIREIPAHRLGRPGTRIPDSNVLRFPKACRRHVGMRFQSGCGIAQLGSRHRLQA